jgi:hypothetical protein
MLFCDFLHHPALPAGAHYVKLEAAQSSSRKAQ